MSDTTINLCGNIMSGNTRIFGVLKRPQVPLRGSEFILISKIGTLGIVKNHFGQKRK